MLVLLTFFLSSSGNSIALTIPTTVFFMYYNIVDIELIKFRTFHRTGYKKNHLTYKKKNKILNILFFLNRVKEISDEFFTRLLPSTIDDILLKTK